MTQIYPGTMQVWRFKDAPEEYRQLRPLIERREDDWVVFMPAENMSADLHKLMVDKWFSGVCRTASVSGGSIYIGSRA